jgi:hypothetical protein
MPLLDNAATGQRKQQGEAMAEAAVRKRNPLGPIRGNLVRIRSREEILATLDADGALDGLPFMPEMLDHCGETVEVAARADKTCDVIGLSGTSRRMKNTVFLSGSRCDGSAHGGCQAGCLLFWREEWLEWADTPGQPIAPPPAKTEPSPSVDTLRAATQVVGEDGKTLYRCQATEHRRATTHIRFRDVSQYVDDVRSKHATVWQVLRGIVVDIFNAYQDYSHNFPRWLRIKGGRPYPFYQGTGTGERTPRLGLQPGDLVEVKSKEEIMAMLGPDQKNRGMWFDSEMLPYCGRQVRVDRLVTQIVDERTGKFIKLSDCVVLEGVVCMGIYRRACQRAFTPYWREAWLRRVPEPAPALPAGSIRQTGESSRQTGE